jgi:two-component system, sensor histidine kinase
MMATELMERANSDPVQNRTIIRRQTQHLARLVDDLLDVSRITSGKIALQRTPVELVELVRRCIASAAASRSGAQRSIEFEPLASPLWIEGDGVRLDQVVSNLLANAIKYTPAGGHVTVTVARFQDTAEVRVRDDGAGIPSQVLPHVFDLFVQAQDTIDRSQGGMGIGLTLVKSLVELHGGRVSVTSDGPGQGSEFAVWLPARASAGQPGAATPPPRGDRSHHSHDILVIEDNADSRDLLRTLFESMGHRVAAAADGLSGVQRAVALAPRVMVVDIGLPGLDGYSVARDVRMALGDAVYLIALTGYGQPGDRERAREAGFDLHLTKPVDFAMLRELLDRPDFDLPRAAGADSARRGG